MTQITKVNFILLSLYTPYTSAELLTKINYRSGVIDTVWTIYESNDAWWIYSLISQTSSSTHVIGPLSDLLVNVLVTKKVTVKMLKPYKTRNDLDHAILGSIHILYAPHMTVGSKKLGLIYRFVLFVDRWNTNVCNDALAAVGQHIAASLR